jgi:hypothetical protein
MTRCVTVAGNSVSGLFVDCCHAQFVEFVIGESPVTPIENSLRLRLPVGIPIGMFEMLYKMTGNRRYLSAAVKIADTLAHNIQPGDADNSPWPFRVNAETGDVHREADKSGKVWVASYTTNWTGALRLFADLARGVISEPATASGSRRG